jgi:hypothetical protein
MRFEHIAAILYNAPRDASLPGTLWVQHDNTYWISNEVTASQSYLGFSLQIILKT